MALSCQCLWSHPKKFHCNTPTFKWDAEDPAEIEAGPLHTEYHDRAMVFAVEADYASARSDRKLCD